MNPQSKKQPQGEDQIEGLAIWPFAKTSGTFTVVPTRHSSLDKRASRNPKDKVPQRPNFKIAMDKSKGWACLEKKCGDDFYLTESTINLTYRKLSQFLGDFYQLRLKEAEIVQIPRSPLSPQASMDRKQAEESAQLQTQAIFMETRMPSESRAKILGSGMKSLKEQWISKNSSEQALIKEHSLPPE